MRPGIVALIRRGDTLLFIRRGADVPFPGVWSPVSGKVELGERPEAAVIREVREEVGLEVRPLREVWQCQSEGGDFHLGWWTAEVLSGELRLDSREVAESRWLRAEEFAQLAPTFEADRRFFAEIWPALSPAERA